MKKHFIPLLMALILFAGFNSLNAQVSGNDYRKVVMDLLPEVNLDNKILFINVWQSSDINSRENNKEFLRVSNIYSAAKLKNGSKGVAFINLSLDKDLYMWMMSVKKDSVASASTLDNTTAKYEAITKLFGDFTGNVIVGSDGNIIAKDIKKENCFNIFRSLITR